MPVSFTNQTDQPLFPEILWSRPTLKSRGGRLLIVGGHKHEFSQVQAIYQVAEAAGAGYVQAALPDTLKPLIGGGEFGHFLPATASGSLGRAALGELEHLAKDYDAVIIGANLTNNSETGILIESLIKKTEQPVVITEETIGTLKFYPDLITGNPKALVTATMNGLFALANNHHMPLAIKPNSGMIGKLEILQQLIDISRCSYVIFDQEMIVASEGEISVTPLKTSLSGRQGIVTALSSIFWLQHRDKPFTALTTAAYVAGQLTEADLATVSATSQAIRRVFNKFED
ncbi:hypothetical protein EPO04_01375 [Patescibacteria group bacterium]|nr:MAG: hypothetical protein EPO04_01375 [Patescibacteria group bacterium]